jgi:4-aminobutyrate aminotransferase-like enzyme/Ser/Thr protein kinase RdoA (MazF antagonist)
VSGALPPIGVATTPPVSLEDAAAIAAEHWDLHGEVRSLPSERDQNFRIGGAVLKLAHPDEDAALLEAQNAALARIASSAPRLAQEVIPARSGEPLLRLRVAGAERLVRLLTYLPGRPIADVRTAAVAGLLGSVGRAMARVDRALEGLDAAALHRDFYWDLEHAPAILADTLPALEDAELRAAVGSMLETYDAEVAPRLPALRSGLIHGDANEYNLLVDGDGGRLMAAPEVTGVLDLGDMVWSRTVYDPAIAAAYATARREEDPLGAVLDVAAGYHAVHPLSERELDVLFPLACLRLCQSACIASVQQQRDPGNRYLGISQSWIHRVLPAALGTPPWLARAALREACGLPGVGRGAAVRAWLADEARAVVAAPAGWTGLDQSPGAPTSAAAADWSLGLHNEARYRPAAEDDTATIHLGAELFVPAGTPVLAPLDATVAEVDGDTAVLAHTTPHGDMWTVLRGLAPDVSTGSEPAAGEPLGRTAGPPLHVQLALEPLGAGLPAFVPVERRAAWTAICPDPGPLVGVPSVSAGGRSKQETLRRRRALISPSLSISYGDPLKMVRGEGAHLIDDTGRRHLDCVNNVAHVGHCNPRVVAALSAQAATLNTNARYLHDHLVDYAQALADRLPDPLSVCFFMNSGSEANDLAMRIARTVTGRTEMLTLAGAYHGNSQADIDVSPYKYAGPGGGGRPAHVLEAPMPDPYRGRHRGATLESGRAYAADLEALVREPAAFISEALMSCAGQIEPPPAFLEHAFAAVRRAGGLCISDEVQIGFGRVGDAFWGFETQGVVPDLVTLGKPIGNGHPMAAVITTPEIAAAFANGMEYMSTFGGNPVSCAVGLAVLREIDDRELQRNARETGRHLLAGLRELAATSPLVGDCRGRGLFLGIELVRDRDTREPAPTEAAYVVERVRSRRVLLSTDGPDHNVIKIKPPLVFTRAHADELLDRLAQALAELGD